MTINAWRQTAALVLLALMANTAAAQSGMSGGQSGMFGSRSMGSGLSAGQRSFGGSGGMGVGSGMGMGSGMGSGMSSAMGNAGQINSSDRFLRQNRRAGDFVGVDAQNAGRDFVGATTGGGTSRNGSRSGQTSRGMGNLMSGQMNANGRVGQFGMGNMNRGSGQLGQAAAVRNAIHSEFQVGFVVPAPVADKLSATVSQRLMETTAVQRKGPIQVEVQGRTAVLRGAVATEHDRVLAEQMARLEPGIDQVQNEIVVAAPAQPLPAANSSQDSSGPKLPPAPAKSVVAPPATGPELTLPAKPEVAKAAPANSDPALPTPALPPTPAPLDLPVVK